MPGRSGRVLVVASDEGGQIHRDVLDLNEAKARERFGKAVVEACGLASEDSGTARAALERRLLALAERPAIADEQPDPPPDPIPEDPRGPALEAMPPETIARAEEYLRDPDILDRVNLDIGRLGVAGEHLNRMILYLVGTSAQLPRPLAAITCGASSSGKSFLAETVSRLFPPEAVLRVTSMTANSLYYFPPGRLRHAFVVAGERSRREDDDQADVTRALREMLECGRLERAVSVRDGDRYVSRLISQEGPIAYSESTTLGNIFDEDANRCLILNTNETEDQTRRIVRATAEAAAGTRPHDVGRICEVHHAMQRMLPRVEVVVPFAPLVADVFPGGRLDSRRNFRHLLQLIRAIALLRFRQRERDDDGRVVATLDDYEDARGLARDSLGATVRGLSCGARELWTLLDTEHGSNEFTTTDVKHLPGVSERTNETRLHELNRMGLVEQTVPPKGRVAARWRLTGREPGDSEDFLPDAEQIRERWSGCELADKT